MGNYTHHWYDGVSGHFLNVEVEERFGGGGIPFRKLLIVTKVTCT
jgi:hypothetical protein